MPKRDDLVRGRGKPDYLYRQLSAKLRAAIEKGMYRPGDLLPSMDDLARTHNLNKATVRQALAELTAAGLVYSVPATGTFVADRDAAPRRGGARSLSIGWISTICFSGKTGRYHTEILAAAQHALHERNGRIMVMGVEGMTPAAVGRRVAEARLDGAILVGPFEPDVVRPLITSGLPSVLMDDRSRGGRVDTLLVDNVDGGRQAMEHLLQLGHRRIALVTGLPGDVSRDRLAGALDAARAAGLDPSRLCQIEGAYSPESGQEAALKLLAMKPRPTAAFFFNDEMAAGALQALHEQATVRIPQDISLIGFDDIAWSSFTHPPLTTMHVELEWMGREAVERLHRLVQREAHVPTTTLSPTRLVIRKSTAPPPSSAR